MATRPGAEHAAERLRYQLARLQTVPQLAAVLDCLFEIEPRRTRPHLAELALVDDSLIFAREVGHDEFRHYVGPRDRLAGDLAAFVTHLGLGPEERAYVERQLASIPRYRPGRGRLPGVTP